MTKTKLYIIGSLRNTYIPILENAIRKNCPTVEPFAEWYGAGPEADDAFKEYNKGRGLSYREALRTDAARHIFDFDKHHLDDSDGAILVMPAGRSCHIEAGYTSKTKPVYLLYPDGEPDDRYDIMVQFFKEIFYSEEELLEYLNREPVSIGNHQPPVPSLSQLFYNAGSAEKPSLRRFDCV